MERPFPMTRRYTDLEFDSVKLVRNAQSAFPPLLEIALQVGGGAVFPCDIGL